MQIGIFTETYKPTVNGVAVSVDTFKTELEKLGHKVYIFCPANQNAAKEEGVFRVPSFQWLGSTKNYPLALPGLTHISLADVPELDIIHCQHLSLMGRMGRHIAKEFKIPLVYTYHTLLTEYTHYIPLFGHFMKPLVIKISRNFANSADVVITPSPSIKRILQGWGVKKPIEVVPTGIYLENYSRSNPGPMKKHFNILDNQQVLLYVGRIAREKNIDFLLESFEHLQKNYPDVHLLLVGGGPEEKYWQDYVKKHQLTKYITFTGFLPKQEVNQIFGQVELFVFPSTTDTQGIVVVEALAAGTPVIAANYLGPADIITNEKDGFLTPLNKFDFTDRIMELLKEEKTWQYFSKNAQKKAKQYSAQRCAQRMESIYYGLTTHHQISKSIT
jgi:glycosyltransferase involved in cell wall biosynthesis